jgi:hypothetical protein
MAIIKEDVPVMDTSAYADGDCMTAAEELTNAMLDPKGTGLVVSLAVIDSDKQSGDFDVFLFDDEPTVASAKNAAIDISAAEMKDKYLGRISVTSSDYKTMTNVHEAYVRDFAVPVKAVGENPGNKRGSKSLWYVMVSRAAKTYSASGLTLKFGIQQD